MLTAAYFRSNIMGPGAVTSGLPFDGGELNYYRRFPGDYASDTKTLSVREHGAYTLLLDYQYSTEKGIRDIREANWICRSETRSDQRAVKSIFEKHFPLQTDGHWNKRVREEIAYASNKRKRASESATLRHERDRNATETRHERDTSASTSRRQNASNPNEFNDSSVRTHSERTAIPDSRLQTIEKTNSKDIDRARAWPDALVLLPVMRDDAVANGVPNPEKEFEAWRADCLAHGRKYVNWMAAWKTRIHRYHEFNRGGNSGTRQTESFGERQRRQSTEAIGGFGENIAAMVREVGRRLPDAKSDASPDDDLPRSSGRFESERTKSRLPGSDKGGGPVPKAGAHPQSVGGIAPRRIGPAQSTRIS